jgi:hypothetical protein
MRQNASSKQHSATQVLNNQNKVTRSAVCPIHNKRSSTFLGPVESNGKTHWQFRCMWDGQVFNALPDKSAPTTPEEVTGWVSRQQQERITKSESKRQ